MARIGRDKGWATIEVVNAESMSEVEDGCEDEGITIRDKTPKRDGTYSFQVKNEYVNTVKGMTSGIRSVLYNSRKPF